jgi:hypothetical protein
MVQGRKFTPAGYQPSYPIERPTPKRDFAISCITSTLFPMPKRRDGIMTVRIPTDEKDVLQAIADKADVTLSDVVVRAVRDFIEANPTPTKGKKK